MTKRKMPKQELSLNALRDMIAFYRQAIDRTDQKLAKLRDHVKKAEAARAKFVAGLEAMEDDLDALAAAEEHAANADVAEGTGSV